MKLIRISQIVPWLILGLSVLVSFILMLNASQQESAVMDELAHIPAGYGYVKYLDYRLNPEHPPLVKALASLPLLFQGLNFPTDKSNWQTDINGQWAVGAQFLYESGNNADKIIQWARLMPMLLTLLLIIFIYIWAKELIGRWWALLPAFLFSFSPTVLAHGHYVTTDIGAALGIFIASYYFIKFLFESNRRHLVFSGLAFGIAQLMKFSAVLLIPFFVFLAIVFCLWKIKNQWPTLSCGLKQFLKTLFRYIFYLIIIFVIGYFLVYLIYFLFTVNYPVEKQKADTEFVLTSFAGGPDPNLETCPSPLRDILLTKEAASQSHKGEGLDSKISLSRRMRCVAEINIGLSQNKILRPLGQYLLGVLMVFQRSSGGNTAYFLGEISAAGWWYYFPVVFVLKEPVPSLILIALALILSIWNILKVVKGQWSKVKSRFWDYLGTHFAEFSMLVFIIFYWVYSIKSPLNIGIRHILPTMPFIYILTASAIKKWRGKFLITVLIIWYLIEVLFVSPHFLSYFNQFAGGTDNGYRYVADSNYDWGQNLKQLKNFVENPPAGEKIDKIAVDYFGGGSPKYYLGNKVEYWQSSKGNPKDQNINWFAVSINTLQGAFGKLHPGQIRNPEDEYQWLKEIRNPYQPDFRAGKSIFIYKL